MESVYFLSLESYFHNIDSSIHDYSGKGERLSIFSYLLPFLSLVS